MALLSLRGASPEEGRPGPLDPARIQAAVERVVKARGEESRRAVADLIDLGPQALAETRRALQDAADPEARRALERAARWLLAATLKPVLEERADSGLTFDGQYADLKAEGPEAAAALLELFDDEETPGKLRIAAAHALADLADRAILPRLRRIEADPLVALRLREEAATLMAILGDPSRMEERIRNLAARVKEPPTLRVPTPRALEAHAEQFRVHIELSNLYYRMRNYRKAIESYDRAIGNLQSLLQVVPRADGRQGLILELAQTYYNAACALSLSRELDRAREMLRKAVELDPLHLKNMEKDGDLKNLRESPGYAEFKAELQKPLERKSI